MGHGPHAGNVVAPSNFVLCIASCSNVPVICCWHIVLFLAIITWGTWVRAFGMATCKYRLLILWCCFHFRNLYNRHFRNVLLPWFSHVMSFQYSRPVSQEPWSQVDWRLQVGCFEQTNQSTFFPVVLLLHLDSAHGWF